MYAAVHVNKSQTKQHARLQLVWLVELYMILLVIRDEWMMLGMIWKLEYNSRLEMDKKLGLLAKICMLPNTRIK